MYRQLLIKLESAAGAISGQRLKINLRIYNNTQCTVFGICTAMKMTMAMRKLQNDTKTNTYETLDVTDYRHMHCDAENDGGDHAGDDEDNSR